MERRRVTDFYLCLQDEIGPRVRGRTPEHEIAAKWPDKPSLLEAWRRHPLTWLLSQGPDILTDGQGMRATASGLNACIYDVYRCLVEIRRPFPDVLWSIKRIPEGMSLEEYAAQLGNTWVEHSFQETEVDKNVVLSFPYEGLLLCIRCRGPEHDVHHAPLDLREYDPFPYEQHFMFPALTAFRALGPLDGNVLTVEATWSAQLLQEQVSPGAAEWEAVRLGQTDVLREWMRCNQTANLEAEHPTFHCSLLYSAARFGHLPCVRALIEGCAHINSQLSQKRSTALHAAAFFPSAQTPQLITYLLDCKADTNLKNDYSLTPSEEACDVAKPYLSVPGAEDDADPTPVPGRTHASVRDLKYGGRREFVIGLRGLIGVAPRMTMQQEFTARPVERWTDKFGGPYDARACWNEARDWIVHKSLRNHPNAVQANLTDEELEGLVLYTGPAYVKVNQWLRELGAAHEKGDDGERTRLLSDEWSWAAFATVLDSGMGKLLKTATVEQQTREFLRGVDGRLATDFFVPDERGMIAFTEYAFMSTTADPAKAEEFAGTGESTMMHVRARPEDAFGLHCGADLEWLSLVAGEKEFLFPPFTMFSVMKRRREGRRTTIEVSPTFAPTV